MEQNSIIIVDDDNDDLELIRDAVEHLKITRPFFYFNTGEELEKHLLSREDSPFLIICDMNLRQLDGFSVKKKISENKDLKYKSVPFIFWSSGASERQIQTAYDLPAQGFFIKPNNFKELCDTMQTILNYWEKSQHPKQVV